MSERTVWGMSKKLTRGLRKLGLAGVTQRMWDAMLGADDAAMRRLVEYWAAGMPEAFPVEILFEEIESHRRAAAILGERNFHGLSSMKRMGCLTEAEVERHKLLRLRNHQTGEFLSEEATLKLLEACKGTHVLCACPELDLPGVHARKKERFDADPDSPWFGEKKQRKWAGVRMQDPWVLAPKTIVAGSNRQTMQGQIDQMESLADQRFQLPAEFGYVAVVNVEATGEKLCEGFIVRFNVETAGGIWLSAGWVGDRLYFYYWRDDADGFVGSASAKTS